MKKVGSRTVAGKRQKSADSEAVRELVALMQRDFREMVVMEKFGTLSFSIGRKVFGFTRGEDALVLKLPADRVNELGEQGWQPLVMGEAGDEGRNGWLWSVGLAGGGES